METGKELFNTHKHSFTKSKPSFFKYTGNLSFRYGTSFFFAEEITKISKEFLLSEETSRHAIQVLRMHKGECLQLTDGCGKIVLAEIISEHKKATQVKIRSASSIAPPTSNITIAISLIKNSSRFEWFIEKATEIGVSKIIPMLCERTEKQHFRLDRMRTIAVSAMLQSQQAWLPILTEPLPFKELLKEPLSGQRYIAHCIVGEEKKGIVHSVNANDQLILIGPEGDFTLDEVNAALQHNFTPVSLGNNRLRTETAGVVACTLLNGL